MKNNLVQQLKNLKNHPCAGAADSLWLAKNREILLMQVRNTMPARISDKAIHVAFISSKAKQFIRWYVSGGTKWGIAFRGSVALLMVILLPMTGWVTSVNAALGSVPGDTLYGLKIVSEKVQISLTTDRTTKIKLRSQFASRRADEVRKLAAKPDAQTNAHVKEAVEKLSVEITTVQRNLEEIKAEKKENPEVIIEAARVVDSATDAIAKVLETTETTTAATEIQAAKTLVDSVGVSAIRTLITTKNDIVLTVTDKEITTAIVEKIKSAETQLLSVEQAIVATTSTVSVPAAKELQQKFDAQVKNAKDAVQNAVDSVKNQQFENAIDKVKEAKQLVSETEKLLSSVASSVKDESAPSGTPRATQ